MKYKHIEAMREVRLWIGQVIVPVAGIVAFSNPEVKKSIADTFENVKTKFQTRKARTQ